jgi:hypothetical protein
MKATPTTPSIAIRFYRGLLRLLPFDFRSDFGPEMEEVFREQSADAQRSGTKGAFRLWWETSRASLARQRNHGRRLLVGAPGPLSAG